MVMTSRTTTACYVDAAGRQDAPARKRSMGRHRLVAMRAQIRGRESHVGISMQCTVRDTFGDGTEPMHEIA